MVVFEILSMLLVAAFLGAAVAQAQSPTPRRTRRVIEHSIHRAFRVPRARLRGTAASAAAAPRAARVTAPAVETGR
jgi:hypothetical protein